MVKFLVTPKRFIAKPAWGLGTGTFASTPAMDSQRTLTGGGLAPVRRSPELRRFEGSNLRDLHLPPVLAQVCQLAQSAFGCDPWSLLGPALVVAGCASGARASISSRYLGPLNLSLACVVCGDYCLGEDLAQGLCGPLYQIQEMRLAKLGQRTRPVTEEIEQILERRENFFAGSLMRDPKQQEIFDRQIDELRSLQRWACVAQDPRPGSLWETAANSQGLLARYGRDRWLDCYNRPPAAAAIFTCLCGLSKADRLTPPCCGCPKARCSFGPRLVVW